MTNRFDDIFEDIYREAFGQSRRVADAVSDQIAAPLSPEQIAKEVGTESKRREAATLDMLRRRAGTTTPARARQAAQTAADTGVPTAFAERNADEIRRRSDGQAWRDLMDRYPRVRQFAISAPHRVSVIDDDRETATGLEDLFWGGLETWAKTSPVMQRVDAGEATAFERGTFAGARFLGALPQALAIMGTVTAGGRVEDRVAAFDAVDALGDADMPRHELAARLGVDPSSDMATAAWGYLQADQSRRVEMRERNASAITSVDEARGPLIAAMILWQAETAQKTGAAPVFFNDDWSVNPQTADEFATWLGFNMGQAIPAMSGSIVAGMLAGPAGLVTFGGTMGLGERSLAKVESGDLSRLTVTDVGAAMLYGGLDMLGVAARLVRGAGPEAAEAAAEAWAKRAGRKIAGNTIEEFIAEAGQEVVLDFAAKVAAGELKWTQEDFVKYLNSGMAGAAGGFGAGVAGAAGDAGGAAVDRVARQRQRRLAAEIERHAEKARAAGAADLTKQKLERLGEIAQSSKVAAEAPSEFAALVGKMVEGGPGQVYVDRSALVAAVEEAMPAPQDRAALYRDLGIADQVQDLRDAGGDIAIDLPTYARVVAPTDLHGRLVPDARLNPADMTPRDAEAWRGQAEQELAALAERAAQVPGRDSAPVQRVREAIKSQLVAAGQSEEIAEIGAAVHEGHAAMLQSYGVDPEGWYSRRFGLRIEKAEAGEEEGGRPAPAAETRPPASSAQTESDGADDEQAAADVNPPEAPTPVAGDESRAGYEQTGSNSLIGSPRRASGPGSNRTVPDAADAINSPAEIIAAAVADAAGPVEPVLEEPHAPSVDRVAELTVRAPGQLPDTDLIGRVLDDLQAAHWGNLRPEERLAGMQMATSFVMTPGVTEDGPRTLFQARRDSGGRQAAITRVEPSTQAEALALSSLPTLDRAAAIREMSALAGEHRAATGEAIAITANASRKVFSGRPNATKLSLAPELGRIIEVAVIYGEAPGFEYGVSHVEIDGTDYAVRSVIRIVPDGSRRLHQIEGFEVAPIAGAEAIPRVPGPGHAYSVGDLVESFKGLPAGAFPLFQDPADPRGSITFGRGETVIRLFESADASTFLHESGHFFLESLRALAADGSDRAARDLNALAAWMGVSSPAEIGVEQHEQFARALEAYMLEGVAPTNETRGVLARASRWLKGVYRSVTELRVQVTPEIRDLMDRLVAADDEQERQETLAGLVPMFPNPEVAGMAGPEYEEYLAAYDEARQAAGEEMARRIAARLRREKTAEYRNARDQIRNEVEGRVNADRRYQAVEFLSTGKHLGRETPEGTTRVKIDRQELVDRYGEAILNRLPRGFGGTVYGQRAEGDAGDILVLSIDDTAELFGFQSGDEMVQQLDGLPPRRRAIKAETDRLAGERLGDQETDADIAEQAIESIHNDHQARFLEIELRALNRRAGVRIPPRAALKSAARAAIERMPVVAGTATGRFLMAERRAAEEATRAAAEGSFARAAIRKKEQLYSHYLYMAARDAEAQAERLQKLARQLQRAGSRERIEGPELDQVDRLLERWGLKRAPRGRDQRASLADWIAEREAEGWAPPITPEMADEGRRGFWRRDLTVRQMQDLHDAVRNIAHVGRRRQQIRLGDRTESILDAASRLGADPVPRGEGGGAGGS